MELQTQRLKIIPCTDELISIITPDQYDIGPHIYKYLDKLKEDYSLFGWGVWLVVNKEENTIIGDIGFKGKPNSEHTVEVGYGIVPSAQNKGYATEAVRKIIDWAFTNDEVEKVVAECLIDNYASIKVLEKLKMNRTEAVDGMFKWELKKNQK
ncbi:GNAT family N-acetyltransferase [Bacillus sp. FJAT-49736]|uniref:GNAT family N-acetyltransferase n=1 Tax=Bacillus sp. FJAT-49736 TaxID=2833582 RepID=UPI001BC932C9|nr:GNAT family N-acetyltransferase [Bacillus sp. FJAT-49736]MBS4174802.1 GNAT family N-acetyltransferase [Bacillus sp. FJAT-49736]MBS4175541.1 GNAT family N-acetyltransferase [Bacillus sp. FJAT-49736]